MTKRKLIRTIPAACSAVALSAVVYGGGGGGGARVEPQPPAGDAGGRHAGHGRDHG